MCTTTDPPHIVNTSLLSGIFPEALKTAVIKPIPQTADLDCTTMIFSTAKLLLDRKERV